MFLEIDVRDVVPSVHVPTLVLHRRHDRLVNVRNGRWLAEHLPERAARRAARRRPHPLVRGHGRRSSEVQEFLTGTRYAPEPDRVLATVLFTDIVDSTNTAAELGDQRWREVLERHQRAVREALDALRRPRGQDDRATASWPPSTGRPAAIRCARAILDSSERARHPRARGRAHRRVRGDGRRHRRHRRPHRRARERAGRPGEVLVSRTVKDLVAGSGIEFAERGAHELKGVPDTWELHAANA